jgi:hypothetical protein
MKLPTLTLSVLIRCSILSAVPLPGRNQGPPGPPTVKDAKKALDPSLAKKTTSLLTRMTGKAKPAVADIKNTNSLAVRDEKNNVFTVDKNARISKGANGVQKTIRIQIRPLS